MWQKLKQSLAQRQKKRIAAASRIPSAVIVPLYDKEGQYYILFTKRTDTVKVHKGEMSFPGGAYEETDGTLLKTALRECNEEIGLVAEKIELLGELDDLSTVSSNYLVSPFVAAIPWPYPFKVDPIETEEIVEMPISALLDKNSRREETRIINGQPVTTYFYHYQGKVVWGATARILNQLLEIIAQVMKDTEDKSQSEVRKHTVR